MTALQDKATDSTKYKMRTRDLYSIKVYYKTREEIMAVRRAAKRKNISVSQYIGEVSLQAAHAESGKKAQ